MSFLKLCKNDKLVSFLRDVFGTNIIRVPEERYRPLTVLAARGGKASFRGKLERLFIESYTFPDDFVKPSQLPNLSGNKTKSIDINLGFKIMDGFLKGLGIPGASIKNSFSGASKVSFSFEDVKRWYIDTNALGRMIIDKKVNPNNPAASIFFGDDAYPFLILDSIITSRDFTISVEESESSDFSLDINSIKNIVEEAGVSVSVDTISKFDLTFKGNKDLAFAFSLVRFSIEDDGTIKEILTEGEDLSVDYKMITKNMISDDSIDESPTVLYSPDRILLTSSPSMIEIE